MSRLLVVAVTLAVSASAAAALVPAPKPGPLGPEAVPIPKAPPASSSPSGARSCRETASARPGGKVTAFYNGKVWKGELGAIPLSPDAQIQLDVGSPVVARERIVFPKTLGSTATK